MRGRTILLALVATGVVTALAPATEASAAAAPASRPVPAPVNPRAIHAVRNCPAPTVARVVECMSIRLTGLPIRRAAGPDLPQPPPGYGPADLDSAYNLSGSGGSGQTIAIVDAYNDPTAESDLAGYRSTFGLPACTVASGCLRIVNQSGLPSALPANNATWAGEESLDLDMVSAICPLCDIILVEAGSNTTANLYAAEDRAVTMGAKFISNSWGLSEYSGETSDDVHFNHPGVAITASTGDSGGPGPQYPAVSRYVTAVGGTTLVRSSGARGWAESAWSGSGSGCSAYEAKPSWQTVPTGCSRRAEADVSATADPFDGVAVYQTYGASGWVEYGGTSVAAPIIAAVYALAGTPLAGSYPAEYPYLNAPGSLYDVVSGSNGSCGIPLCTAGNGWDGPTGLGTPDGKGAFIPPIPVFLNNPGGQTTTANTPVSLTLNGGGGFTPYTWTSTALPPGLSLNGSTGVISGTPTTVGTSSITVTMHSTDGTTASTTFNWTVQSALSLDISGPSLITGKGTYTYTAETSGYTNPSFSWSERFCADAAGDGCTSWQNIGSGSTETRVLNKDCSGSGTNTDWLQVTATNSDGRQQTAQLIVELCQEPV